MKLLSLLLVNFSAAQSTKTYKGSRHIEHRLQHDHAFMRMPSERWLFEYPRCTDGACGQKGKDLVEFQKRGCVFKNGHPLMQDSGSLTYPPLNSDGSRSEYGRRDNCIWQITAATPGKWLKLKVTYVDIEYDAHCGLDRVHIFKGQIPAKGFTSQLVKKNPEMRVARLCGGMNPDKNRGNGPMRHWNNFHDASTTLTKFYEKGKCDVERKRRRGKWVNIEKKCLQNGFDNWIDLQTNSVTIAFDADQKEEYTGFTVEWKVEDAPHPPPPLPTADIPLIEADKVLLRRIAGSARGNSWGLLKQTRIQTAGGTNPNEMRQIRQRAYNLWRDHSNRREDIFKNLAHKNCMRNTNKDMMPKFLADQLHGELNRAFHQDQLKNMLQIYQKVLYWKTEYCAKYQDNKYGLYNQIERLIGTIYNYDEKYQRQIDFEEFSNWFKQKVEDEKQLESA